MSSSSKDESAVESWEILCLPMTRWLERPILIEEKGPQGQPWIKVAQDLIPPGWEPFAATTAGIFLRRRL